MFFFFWKKQVCELSMFPTYLQTYYGIFTLLFSQKEEEKYIQHLEVVIIIIIIIIIIINNNIIRVKESKAIHFFNLQ